MSGFLGGLFSGITLGFGWAGVILHSNAAVLVIAIAALAGGALWAYFEWRQVERS